MAGGQAPLARLARDWQRLLPAGIRIKADGDHLYAWNPALVGRLAAPGRPLWDQVREHAANGRWLGYGIHMFEPGAKSRVTIHAPDGRLVAGFIAPRAHDELYAAARARDWTEATGILHTYEIQSL